MFVHQGRVSGALLLVASVSQLAVAQGPRATADEIARSVDSLAARVVSSGVSPALGVAIVMDGKTIFSKAYGFADATNRIAANDETRNGSTQELQSTLHLSDERWDTRFVRCHLGRSERTGRIDSSLRLDFKRLPRSSSRAASFILRPTTLATLLG